MTILAGVLALSLAGIATADAQAIYYGGPRYYAYGPGYYAPGMPPSAALRIVRRAGYVPLGAPLRRGPRYVVAAVGRAGGQVRVVIHAYSGEIMNVRPVVAMRPYGPPPYQPRVATAPGDPRNPPPNYQDHMAPPPADNGAPPQRIANAKTNVIPAKPIHTPIPRPRPEVAMNDAAAHAAPVPRPATQRAPVADTATADAPPQEKPAEDKQPIHMVPVAPLD